MTERERWVVYPLLFLALGASLRDKLVESTTTKSIRCQELLIVDEPPVGREPVILARLGSVPRVKAEDPYSSQLVLNGQIDVVDRDLNQTLNPLVSIGRAQFGPQGIVGGQILVKGAINATFYAYQGQPLVPVLRGVFPGSSIPAELLRAAPEALAPRHPANPSDSIPPTNSSPAQPPSPAQPGEAPAAAPLADPSENR